MTTPLALAEDAHPTIPLWPADKMPGKGSDEAEMQKPSTDHVIRLTNVSEPTLTMFHVPKANSPTPIVIVCPGGGYGHLAMNKEGTDVAEWLNFQGVAAAVLKYRVPGNRPGAFQDIQRAVRLVRSEAAKWNIDPAKVGIMGFSAGGHLCARAATDTKAAYEAVDAVDSASFLPDFSVLVYPAFLDDKEGKVVPEVTVRGDIAPMLIVHSNDDERYVVGSKILNTALTEAKAPVEYILFETGGHGYGLKSRKEAAVWPERCAEWMARKGLISSSKATE